MLLQYRNINLNISFINILQHRQYDTRLIVEIIITIS